jgi:hypothetical protein
LANVDFSAVPQRPQAGLRLPNMEEPDALADAIAPLLPVGIAQKAATSWRPPTWSHGWRRSST